MKKIDELKKLLEVCAEDSIRKEWVRSRRIYEHRKFSEGESMMKKRITNKDIVNGSFVIPDGVTEIGNMAFSGCTSLESIIIPESVTEIGIEAFYGCSSLKKISLPKKVKLGYDVFYVCHPDLKIEYRD